MCHTVQKQAKIKQNSKENQTKLTLLNPKKNKQFLQNSTKKSNKSNTHKKKQTINCFTEYGYKNILKILLRSKYVSPNTYENF